MNRAELSQALPVDDDARVASILAANRHRFLGFLERRIGRRDLAEEILQDAYLRSIGKGEALRDEESAVAWFYRVLRNTLIDHLRRAGSEARARAAFGAEVSNPIDPLYPDLPELHREACQCIGSTLETLKPEYAEAVRTVDLDGGDLASLAASTGISAGNAAVRLHRGRQALRKRMIEICGSCTLQACLDCSCKSADSSAGAGGQDSKMP